MQHATPLFVTADCPCVGHCTTALGDDVCRSCQRTMDEITRWPALGVDERLRINQRIAALCSEST